MAVANSRLLDGQFAILGFMWRIRPTKSSLPIRRALTICAPLENCEGLLLSTCTALPSLTRKSVSAAAPQSTCKVTSPKNTFTRWEGRKLHLNAIVESVSSYCSFKL